MTTLRVDFPKRSQTEGSYVYPVILPLAPQVMNRLAEAIPTGGKLVEKVEREWKK